MKQTINISGKTFSYFLGFIILISGVIYFMNKYDNDKKIEGLGNILKKLSEFDFEDMRSVLLTTNLDSLSDSDIDKVAENISLLKSNDDLKNIGHYNSQILIQEDSDFYVLDYQSMAYYRRSGNLNVQLFGSKSLSTYEKEMISLLDQAGINIENTIKENFSFLKSSKVIYPIGSNEKRKIFFEFSYSEKR